jgi:hypothetical protein
MVHLPSTVRMAPESDILMVMADREETGLQAVGKAVMEDQEEAPVMERVAMGAAEVPVPLAGMAGVDRM